MQTTPRLRKGLVRNLMPAPETLWQFSREHSRELRSLPAQATTPQQQMKASWKPGCWWGGTCPYQWGWRLPITVRGVVCKPGSVNLPPTPHEKERLTQKDPWCQNRRTDQPSKECMFCESRKWWVLLTVHATNAWYIWGNTVTHECREYKNDHSQRMPCVNLKCLTKSSFLNRKPKNTRNE